MDELKTFMNFEVWPSNVIHKIELIYTRAMHLQDYLRQFYLQKASFLTCSFAKVLYTKVFSYNIMVYVYYIVY